jgi:filamentous hemagglutinin family protein
MQVKTTRSLINKLFRITLKKLSSALRNISTPVTTSNNATHLVTTNKISTPVTPSNDGVYLVTTNKTRPFSHILHCVALKSFYHFLIFSLVFNPFAASASEVLPIVVDGTTNTQVTKTASGVDQINIAAPNSSGLSHNRFTHYNINQSGQIINNFSGQNPSEVVIGSGASAVTSTQIGGLVTTNQNLINSGSARVILNEVTSSSNTQLRGYAEIAGTKAELIIANSNGITCLGCGFINTSRLSFIAGSRDSDIDGNLAFKLKEQSNPNLMVPLITISGLGLDVENVTATEIIASSIKLISTIYEPVANPTF